MKISLLIFAIFTIGFQMPHTDYVVKLGSNLNDKDWKFKFLWWTFRKIPSAKRIQSGGFSLIVANAIMFTVLLEMHWVALLWMIVEVVLGCTYVYAAMKRRERDGRSRNPERVEWFAGYFIACLLPFCIYSFSFMYAQYDWIIEFFGK